MTEEQERPVRRDAYGNDMTVWLMWTWMPGRIGWVPGVRRAYSSREAMNERAEEWRRFLRSCRLPDVVEVRREDDGPPPEPPQLDPS